MSARTVFCRRCGAAGAQKYGKDRQRRQRYRCAHCDAVFVQRTRTVQCGSHLSDAQWRLAARLFSTRAGMSAADMGRVLAVNAKTAQRLNRIFRSMVSALRPQETPGVSEWDESMFSKQWVLGGVSRDTKQCVLGCIPNRRAETLCPIVLRHAGPEGLIFTDEHRGYDDLYRHMTVCHAREFVNSQARFVHTNTQEGIWGHCKTLSWHVYRGFPRHSLPQFLSECMFRYNLRDYELRVSALCDLISRKTNSYLV